MIRVNDVTKRYEGKRPVHALRGVTLHVAKGDMVAITGPSGCGKSTLLNIIGGLDCASGGSVVVDGVDLRRLDGDGLARLRRQKIGFLFQFFNLLPTLTALDNVALAMRLAGIRNGEATARSIELLRVVGLADRLDHLPEELSGGEQQRVALARAVALQPPVLLADEPTGNLDSTSAKRVLALLSEVHEQFGTTVVLVTHDAVTAEFCHRILTMRDGQLTDEGG